MTGREMFPVRGGWPFTNPINCPFTINLNSPQAKGLLAWWPLGAGQYGMLRDVQGHWKMTPVNSPALKAGAQGRCTLFDDGDSEYLYYNGAVVTGPPFTFSAWAARDDDTIDAVVVSVAQNWGINDNYLRINGADTVRFLSGNQSVNTTATISDADFHHLCGVAYAVDSRAVFLDGANKATDSDVGSHGSEDKTTIGVMYGGDGGSNLYHFSGRIRDVRIYDRALSDAEVKAVYENPWELFAPTVPYILAAAPAAGGLTVSLDALAIAGSALGLTVSPGAVSIALDTLALSGVAQTLGVSPGAVQIALDTLGLVGAVGALSVTPGAVSIPLDTLTLTSLAQTLGVAPGAVNIALDALALVASARSLTVSAGLVVALDALALSGTAQSLTVAPGAVAVELDALNLVAAILALTVALEAGLIDVDVSDAPVYNVGVSDALACSVTVSDELVGNVEMADTSRA